MNYADEVLIEKRQYIIEEVKAPLMDAIVKYPGSSKLRKIKLIVSMIELIFKYPAVTRANSKGTNANTIMDIEQEFFKYENNPCREPLFRAFFRMWQAELSHDEYYEGRQDWILEQIFKAVLTGKWMPRRPGHPVPKWWKEPQPHGGHHSITYKLWLNRDEILKIIGGI